MIGVCDMIFMFGMVIGIIYGTFRYVFKCASETTLCIMCGCILLLSLIVGSTSGEMGGALIFGIFFALIVFLACSNSEAMVENPKEYDKAVKSQKRQDKYDNEWGYIKHEVKKK